MPRINVKYTTIQHPMLDSKTATAAALFNEWIKWCEENGIHDHVVADISKCFMHPAFEKEQLKQEKEAKNGK